MPKEPTKTLRVRVLVRGEYVDLLEDYCQKMGLDPNAAVGSLMVQALRTNGVH